MLGAFWDTEIGVIHLLSHNVPQQHSFRRIQGNQSVRNDTLSLNFSSVTIWESQSKSNISPFFSPYKNINKSWKSLLFVFLQVTLLFYKSRKTNQWCPYCKVLACTLWDKKDQVFVIVLPFNILPKKALQIALQETTASISSRNIQAGFCLRALPFQHEKQCVTHIGTEMRKNLPQAEVKSLFYFCLIDVLPTCPIRDS